MISDANRYYGSALSTIVNISTDSVEFKRASESFAGFYLINEKVPLYIKYSTSRRGPWVFNFQRVHQEHQEYLYMKHGECIIAFVCGKDGIAALTHNDFRKALDNYFDEQESVTVRRRHNEMYRVRGRDGALEKCVSRSSLEEILFQITAEECNTK